MNPLVWFCLLSLALLPTPSLPLHVPIIEFQENNHEINGEDLLEDDIIMTEDQRSMILGRKATPNLNFRWPEGPDGYPLVPYVINRSGLRENITKVIDNWAEHTCIKFEEATNLEEPHLEFKFSKSGCWANLGYHKKKKTMYVSLGSQCNLLRIITHETGHAMGFVHEQFRSDRNSYLNVYVKDELNGGYKVDLDYKLHNSRNYGVPYDLTSAMHSGRGVALYPDADKLYITVDPRYQEIMGQKLGREYGLSFRDKHIANKMYNCIEKWAKKCNLDSDPCKNNGYLGRDCQCLCEPGTSGDYCETVTGGYYDGYLDPCTEMITEEGTVTSPNYPENYDKDTKCIKWIVAPECHVPKLTFNDFEMYKRTKNSRCRTKGLPCCFTDLLEIRTKSLYFGEMYCGTDIANQDSFTASSKDLVLRFRTITSEFKGFSADLTFVPVPGCQTEKITSE